LIASIAFGDIRILLVLLPMAPTHELPATSFLFFWIRNPIMHNYFEVFGFKCLLLFTK
jgi:hypothetical protein